MDLRTRLMTGMAVIAVVLGIGAVAIIRTTEARLLEQVDARLRNVQVPMRSADFDRPTLPGQRFSSVYVGGLTGGGDVVPLLTPDVGAEALALPAIAGSDARRSAVTGRPFTADSADGDVRFRVLGGRVARGGTIVVALPLSDVDGALDRLFAVVAFTTVAILTLLGLVAWWVIHLGVQPIKAMTATASSIAGGDLSGRVPDVAPGTEAGALGMALNQMLGRIEDAFAQRTRSEERLRRFVADASHELRTPLATIRGYAELHRAGALSDPEELAGAMRRTEQEAVRMGSLVEDLLHLARLDQGRPLESAPVDLAALADDAVRDALARQPGRPVQATVPGGGPVLVMGDEARLRQVVANLVGNAVVHTDVDTPVEVVVRSDGAVAVLEVADEGPGMTAEAAERAFERFYRADASRSRDRGGSGLGLAIVEATVAAHGGSVSLTSEEGRGTTVSVVLPCDGSS